MFYPIMVGVLWLICHQFLSVIFTNQIGHWWWWYVVNVIFKRFFEVRRKYIIFIASNLLFFAHYIINFIDFGLFNSFSIVYLISIICLFFL